MPAWSTSDPNSRLYRKAAGREAKLCYMGHATMENRLYARQARLEAERDGAETIDFGPLSAVALPGGTEKIIQAEQKLFELRRTARAGQKSQLNERSGQLQEEIEGLKGSMTQGSRRSNSSRPS
jgi:hypothetical protein